MTRQKEQVVERRESTAPRFRSSMLDMSDPKLGNRAAWLGPLVAAFGLLTVFGVAARNQLMVIRRFRHLHGKQASSSGVELVLQGTRERFAPILITAVIIALALLPLLFMGDIPGFEILRPTALVVLSGMVTAMLVDLFVVPALCLRLVRPDFPTVK